MFPKSLYTKPYCSILMLLCFLGMSYIIKKDISETLIDLLVSSLIIVVVSILFNPSKESLDIDENIVFIQRFFFYSAFGYAIFTIAYLLYAVLI